MTTRIAVVGAGAIGGVLAAWLAQRADVDLTLCVRAAFERLRVDVPGGATIDVAPRALTEPASATPVDWVIVATKAYDTDGAKRWLERLVGSGTMVAIAQNGVEHRERFAGAAPPERLIPVIVELSAERDAPGRIRQRSTGRLTAPDGAPGRGFAALFEHAPIAAETTDDFTTAAWRKLVVNAAGVVQALTGQPARVVHDERMGRLVHDLAAEAAAVGRAEGARLDADIAEATLTRLRASLPDGMNSMGADRVAGRPMEIDARNGVIVRLGKKHGIATPLHAMAVAILENVAAPPA